MNSENQTSRRSFLHKLWIKVYQKRFVIILFILVFGILAIFFGNNIVKIHELKQKQKSLEDNIAYEKNLSETLDQQLNSVEQRMFIEKIAKETLNMVYPDEKIVTLEYKDNDRTGKDTKE